MTFEIPGNQRAVQLVGPDTLRLNAEKPIVPPGRRQILCRVEAVGLCFSDLKLLKQFSQHVRKSEITAGIDDEALSEIPSYVPGEAPTVPGHEAVVRVWAVGEGVDRHRPGERYLVQTDYRWLRTAAANAAFGYNFEGALQEFVLMDERVITSPEGESMLIPASEDLSASAIALVEPWACVEDAYASRERQSVKSGGRALLVHDADIPESLVLKQRDRQGRDSTVKVVKPAGLGSAAGAYDDVIYLGARADVIEALFPKLAPGGLLNIVLCGKPISRPVATPVGQVHYGGIRIVGTTGCDPAEAMRTIPQSGEVRSGDMLNVVGAAGPMGVMHVVRDVCAGLPNLAIAAGDLDGERLAALSQMAGPLAEKSGVAFAVYDPKAGGPDAPPSYTIVMVPVPGLVAEAVSRSADHGIINIFAGIPADVHVEIDLNAYIEKKLYFIGTSGSTLEDMKAVLAKVEGGALDTNLSVAAVCDLDGALDGMRAIEQRRVSGKIIVYPSCRGLGLVRLEEMGERLPDVAKLLDRGMWTREAEQALLRTHGD